MILGVLQGNPQANLDFLINSINKLQVIKTSRLVNLRLLVSLNRVKYSKFNLKVLKAFIELLSIVHKSDQVEINEWEGVLSHIRKNQSKILTDISNISEMVEKENFDKQDIWQSRKAHFGETPTEALLFKY